MVFDRVRTIVEKEWAELFKNRLVLFTITLLPILFTILPLAILYFSKSSGIQGGDLSDMPASFARACGIMSAQDCMQVYIVNEFMLLYMMLPLMIPITIASYGIVGEKTTRSLEPLLATPITTVELLAGKNLAASIPAIIATWACFGIFLLLVPLTGASKAVQAYTSGPTWLLAILAVGPLIAILAVNFAIIVSSRVNDPRAAQQISSILILPLMALLFGQIAGIILINVQLMLISIVVLSILDIGIVYFGSILFQREYILTRWK